MIRLERVSKIFAEEKVEALRDVDLQIEMGEFVFVTGESGSGKTTLLKLLTKELSPERGRIEVNGVYLDEVSRKRLPYYRRSIGILYQDARLVKDKSVFENVLLARQIVGVRRRDAVRQVSAVLSLLGLTGLFKRYPDELSGGEQQKVCLARALVNHPALLLADEPTGNLDPAGTVELMDLLIQINKRGVTVVTATHDVQQVERCGHRIVKLERGRLL